MDKPSHFKNERHQIFRVYAREMRLFKGRLIMWLAAVIIALIPTIYTSIYVLSLWDPYQQVAKIPVGIATMDKGIEYKGKYYNLGNDILEKLKEIKPFYFIQYDDYKSAERGVRRGDDYFALVIPADFSEKTIPGNNVGRLQVITSGGTNFVATLMAERFSQIVANNLNDKLAIERWRNVISGGREAYEATLKLRDGIQRAIEGSVELKSGLESAEVGAKKLAEGDEKLASGLAGINTVALTEKGEQIHGATEKLALGLSKQGMIGALVGLPSDKDMKKLAAGAKLYQSKVEELAAGLEKARGGAEKIAEKKQELVSGLDQLKSGSEQLTSGLEAINQGLDRFAQALNIEERRAETLAVSVLPKQKELTPVTVNGEAYAPYFMCLSIWLGGVMSAFLFNLVIFPVSMEHKTKTAKIIGKGLAPTTIVFLGTVFLGLVVQFWMRVPVINAFGYYTTLLVAVIVFNSLILSFVKMVGDAGKLIAVLFLVIQLSCSGGIYPIQTSPEFYQFLYPYLPLTHVMNALRASMFGSYDGDWIRYLLFLIPWLMISFAFAFFSADRYKYVADDQYGPALTVSFKREGPEMRA